MLCFYQPKPFCESCDGLGQVGNLGRKTLVCVTQRVEIAHSVITFPMTTSISTMTLPSIHFISLMSLRMSASACS